MYSNYFRDFIENTLISESTVEGFISLSKRGDFRFDWYGVEETL